MSWESAYTIKFGHGVENNEKCEEEFRLQFWEKLNRWKETENETDKYDLSYAIRCTQDLASVSERELMSMKGLGIIELSEQRCNINDTAIERIATAIVTDSEEDIERITNEWAKERVKFLHGLFREDALAIDELSYLIHSL
ncbi:hypothetical protein TWF788_003578 [Orbilia oligospora]|uniref:Uncharacterized protein n=1 Tax=Orbilia oligospora TaxID=2813651 RepID=A0A7C8U1X1_ORBOL|nr:hypothetical protein TWF788_003578 [Orbilia oligospora]